MRRLALLLVIVGVATTLHCSNEGPAQSNSGNSARGGGKLAPEDYIPDSLEGLNVELVSYDEPDVDLMIILKSPEVGEQAADRIYDELAKDLPGFRMRRSTNRYYDRALSGSRGEYHVGYHVVLAKNDPTADPREIPYSQEPDGVPYVVVNVIAD